MQCDEGLRFALPSAQMCLFEGSRLGSRGYAYDYVGKLTLGRDVVEISYEDMIY